MTDADLFGRNLLKPEYRSFSTNTQLNVSMELEQNISLADALKTYLVQKGNGKRQTFHLASQRSCTYLVYACGSKNINNYTRSDALKYRDYLIERGMVGSSVGRVLNSIRAIFNFAISEYALDFKNPFLGMYFDKSAGVSKRPPIPIADIRKVQQQCRLMDDELRWLVALVSDTGMRLAEGAGLLKSDIILSADIPYISLKPHLWRPLKTSGSQRDIPLVGDSLWAAQRLSDAFPESLFAFPRYNKKDVTNSNSASAALNKWLRQYVPEGCTMHSFRHSMRDRLRAIECQSEIIDRIGGWTSEGVGQGYGFGYPLNVLQDWIKRLEI